MNSNNRPGVYSQYEVSSVLTQQSSDGYAAVIAVSQKGDPGEVQTVETLAQAKSLFGEDEYGAAMTGCIQILLASGVSRVYCVSAGNPGDNVEPEGYGLCLEQIAQIEGIKAVVCDVTGLEGLLKVREQITARSSNRRESLAFCGALPDEAAAVAKAVNSERVVLCTPACKAAGTGGAHPVYGAAAMAGLVLSKGDPVYPFNGEQLVQVAEPDEMEEADIQECIDAGVTVLETVDGVTECIRAVTTRTLSGGAPDKTLYTINAVLIIDDVITTIRNSLKRVLRGVRTTSMDVVASQVAVELAAKQDQGLLVEYRAPVAYAHASDPSVCVVELSFTVAHVISQIHVVAHIQM